MTDARTTEGVVLALEGGDPAARTTEAVVLAMAKISIPTRTTQAAVLALYGLNVPTRTSQVAVLVLGRNGGNRVATDEEVASGAAGCDNYEVQCWKITRKDGQVFAFTTHDEDVTYLGTTYKRCDSLKASAISGTTSSGTNTGDVQLQGILSDSSITAEDMYAGRYDNARVEVHLVDWFRNLGRILTRGIVSRTIQRENDYTMTALTGGARLEQQPLLEVYSPACRWELGDSRCQVDLAPLQVTGTVTSVPPANVVTVKRKRVFGDTGRAEAATVFKDGRLTWTSGPNNGLTFEVKTMANGVVTLWVPCPFNIEVGDTYTLRPGCSKTKQDCITRYNNYPNFGGFPDLPGNDSINLTPNRTQ